MLTPPPDEANEERTFHAVLDFASAGNVLPLQRIWETQRHHLGQLHRLGYSAVSKAVNSVRNDGPELIEPISG